MFAGARPRPRSPVTAKRIITSGPQTKATACRGSKVARGMSVVTTPTSPRQSPVAYRRLDDRRAQPAGTRRGDRILYQRPGAALRSFRQPKFYRFAQTCARNLLGRLHAPRAAFRQD